MLSLSLYFSKLISGLSFGDYFWEKTRQGKYSTRNINILALLVLRRNNFHVRLLISFQNFSFYPPGIYLLKVDNEDTRILSLLITWNIFYTLFWCFQLLGKQINYHLDLRILEEKRIIAAFFKKSKENSYFII